jgi:type II secretory pathway component PulF
VAVFRYRAVDGSGRESRGDESAGSAKEAATILRGRGLFPLEVTERGVGGGGSGRLATADLAIILRALGDQFHAGVPLDRALRSTAELLPASKARRLTELQIAVRAGRPLSDAMGEGGWPTFAVNSVRAGEAAGALDKVLVRLADHYEQTASFRSEIGLSLAYPMFILGVGLVSLGLIVAIVVPKLTEVFRGYEDRLPLITTLFLAFAGFLRNRWPLALALVALAVAGVVSVVGTTGGRGWLRETAWRTPWISGILRAIEWGRLSRTMSLLLTNGVPVVQALELARDGTSMKMLRALIERLVVGIRSGGRLSLLLKAEEGVPEMVRQMVAVGEETGAFDSAFERTAEFYERKVRQSLRKATTFAEPVLIVLIAAGIGVMIVAVILGIYSIMEVTR